VKFFHSVFFLLSGLFNFATEGYSPVIITDCFISFGKLNRKNFLH